MHPAHQPIIKIGQQMCGLVLHYDQCITNVCEAVGLVRVKPWLPDKVIPVRKVIILVSPSFYNQRKRFYAVNNVEVVPLLFKWDSLGADQLKKLMRISEKDSQLYVSVMLNLLRKYQRYERIPSFTLFLEEVKEACKVQGQGGPLLQRLELLKTFVFESDDNVPLRDFYKSLDSLMDSGTLVVADLTDPMLSADEASGIFQVLVEQFRKKPMTCGKVLACDEAHKYLSGGGPGNEELTASIVDIVRLMRHEGIRVLISTQSPLSMPPELLELVSITILHSFQSIDWFNYLSSKISMPHIFEKVKRLLPGNAIAASTKMDIAADNQECQDCVEIQIRNRLTTDLGASVSNRHTSIP
jgi:hypothetical protein